MSRRNHAAASGAHLGLHALMPALPLTGYWSSAAGGYSLPFFRPFQWPRVLPLDKASSHIGEELPLWGARAIHAVVGLHVAAVAWHHLVRRDGVLSRMPPGIR